MGRNICDLKHGPGNSAAKHIEILFAELLQILRADRFLMKRIAGHTAQQSGIRTKGQTGMEPFVKGNPHRAKVFSRRLVILTQTHGRGLRRDILNRLIQYPLKLLFCQSSIHPVSSFFILVPQLPFQALLTFDPEGSSAAFSSRFRFLFFLCKSPAESF